MEDAAIVALYWERDERALSETALKYGRLCHNLAYRLLGSEEDAGECVNDTWFEAWRRIPPARPERLGLWLQRVTRGLAVSTWRRNHAQKRFAGVETLLSELEECVPAAGSVEDALEARELGACIEAWLKSRSAPERVLFIRRYWHGESVAELAGEAGLKPRQLTMRLYRLRQDLRAFLEKEGISL